MNAIFSNLSKQTLANIEDQLSNNEVSTDEELVDLFIEELELTLDQAEAAIRLRDQYRIQIFRAGHGPLHNEKPVVFDPDTRTFN
ncbi:hypothetical protein RTH46_09065 [Pseudomonas sp. zfem004]|jgi:hypothetical protein|uniref:Uncharacterized protein n=3 Tax=Pseudomonas TaxID=286 RepID=A0A2S3WQD3_PSEPU|nr:MULTISPECIES: hypothetical protein [Pseudomonas]MBI6918121.1 hypothetical protein [Pseudomonas monteilii]MCE0938076.1 hypothetical protein [Pseudomonas kurunegalensis]MDD2015303.1 hypothetical protein [Pseudomonas putida]MDU9402641.1 hypothetical protein [Pseudomonas sp. zfem004]PKF23663.1 hypothetical protein CW309_25945 [Pseudomonas hunanensis]